MLAGTARMGNLRAVIAFIVLAGCSVGEETRVVSADDPLPDDLVAGDVVSRAGVEVVVPEPGQTVSIVAEYDDGSSVELVIRNPLGGTVELVDRPEEPLVIAANAPNACADGAFHLMGHKWKSQFQWKFWASSTPKANIVANVEQALKNSAAAITTQRNNCGLADQVEITQAYKGRTGTAPGIKTANGAVTCTGTDGQNVVGFGALPSGVLGVACAWSDGSGGAVEGDIRLTTARSWYALGVPAGCSNRFGVQAIATHEFGHVFGLGHVSESLHPNLTMSTAAGPCTNNELTLGLGDVRGLRQLY